MSDNKAKMFNRRAAEPKWKSDLIVGSLGIQPGQAIADIGSGGGYFTFRFSAAAGFGVAETFDFLPEQSFTIFTAGGYQG